MPAFQLRFEDTNKPLNHGLEAFSEIEALLQTWKACKKVATYLEYGERLENLADRLGYMLCGKKSKHPSWTRDFASNSFHINNQSDGSMAKIKNGGPKQVSSNKRLSGSSSSTPRATMQKPPSIRSGRTVLESQFQNQGLISFLLPPPTGPSKPILKLSLDLFGDESNVAHQSHQAKDPNQGYEPKDPAEVFILPDPNKIRLHHGLDSITEQDDEDTDYTQTPRATTPVLFVNPFASADHQLLTPPPTPPTDSIPPHLGAEEETETTSTSQPIDLTGQIRKLKTSPVAQGGASDIYYGVWRLPVPQKVAIKVLRTTYLTGVSDLRRRLRREIDVWGMCRHRNIVPLFGYVSDFSPLDSLISPWMKNGSVTTYLRTKQSSWSERLKLLGDVVAGLKHLHHFQPPIIHGDLKPANVLVSDNGDACLCDFGLARVLKLGNEPSGFTTSHFGGSVRYMAPELCGEDNEDGPPRVNKFTDIYALGCVGLEIVTDKIPYANRTLDSQVMHDIIVGRLPAREPSQMTLANNLSLNKFWVFIMAAWRADPNQRPDVVSASKMLAECEIRRGPPLVADLGRRQSQSLSIGSSTGGLSRSRAHSRTRTQSAESSYHAILSSHNPPSEHLSVPSTLLNSSSSTNLSRSRSVGPGTYRNPSAVTVQRNSIKEGSASLEERAASTHSLDRLKRSTSAILRGTVGLGLSVKRRSLTNFRPSVNASEQVWHDT